MQLYLLPTANRRILKTELSDLKQARRPGQGERAGVPRGQPAQARPGHPAVSSYASCRRAGPGCRVSTRQAGGRYAPGWAAVRAAGAAAALRENYFSLSKNKFIHSKRSSIPTKCHISIFLKIKLYLSQPNFNDVFLRAQLLHLLPKMNICRLKHEQKRHFYNFNVIYSCCNITYRGLTVWTGDLYRVPTIHDILLYDMYNTIRLHVWAAGRRRLHPALEYKKN